MRRLKRALERHRAAQRERAVRAKRGPGRPGNRSSALASLTASLIALPGLAGPAAADTPAAGIRSDYRFGFYSEQPMANARVVPGSETQRFEVQSHQLKTRMPLFDRFEVGLDVVHESMSGASPWYVIPGADGEPVQVMTGATISDARTDLLAGTSYYLDAGRAGLSGGISWENDYLAFNAGLDGERHFNEGNTTLLSGAGASFDTLTPTDADSDPFRPGKETRQSYSLFAGIAQVLTQSTALQSTLDYKLSRGYLSDPYKRTLVAGEPVGDERPDLRNQLTWLTRLRQHIEATRSTVHLDYRFYADDWHITSHTVELAWYQTLWREIRLIPSVRYYSQSQADFYGPYFEAEPANGHYSSDYRLSPFGALSFRVRAEAAFELWRVGLAASFTWERYLSSGDFALGNVKVPSPGLVDFDLFSIGLQTRF